MAGCDSYRELGEAAWSWVLAQVAADDGPWLPEAVTAGPSDLAPGPDRDSLYAGIAGLAPVLVEIALHRPLSEDEQRLSAGIVARLSGQAGTRLEPSLYDGLAGDATALRMLAPGREQRVMQRLSDLRTPEGWRTSSGFDGSDAPLTDVMTGTAGVVLTAVWVRGAHASAVAATGGEALLAAAEPTRAGLDWGMRPGQPSRMPNFSHGTAGIASALAVAGAALDRQDFVDAAVAGAQHLLAVGSLDDDGFVVPHTIPPSVREVEPVTYTWCHGPAGTSYLFAALERAGVPDVLGHDVRELRRRCLRSILASGVPQRLRPGFWDNDGRCCGTAGVGDVLLDAAQDCPDQAQVASLLAGARTMADALVERALQEADHAFWRFTEHRNEQSLLPPGTTWMQGAAGIAAYLFRLARVLEDGPGAPVVDRPDQWWAVPPPARVFRRASPT